MKKLVIQSGLTLLFGMFGLGLFAQVGINADGSQPDPSAMLDVKSPVRGFLPPRIALVSADTPDPVASPVAMGLLVFNTAASGQVPNKVVPGYYFWNGTRWMPVAAPTGNNPGEMLFWDGSAWITIPAGNHGQQLFFCNGRPTWGGCFALISTDSISMITQRSAVSGGNILNEGGSPVIQRGVCWGTGPNPTLEDSKTIDGSGPGQFVSNLSGLSPMTTYYLRAYASNGAGTSYGNERVFTTGEFTGAPVTSLPLLQACADGAVAIPVTVSGFNFIGSFQLTLLYNATTLVFQGAENTAGFPGFQATETVAGQIVITGTSPTGISLPANSELFRLHFSYGGGQANLGWYDNGISCEYKDGTQFPLEDMPFSMYYNNGEVNEIPTVEPPVFAAGPESFHCQGVPSVTYTATAAHSVSLSYDLDAASMAAGITLDTATGTVSFPSAWYGTSVITAKATGCGGPKTAQHTVTVGEGHEVGITINASGNSVCQGTVLTFTSTISNGGANPAYQWKVNGTDVTGATGQEYTYTPGQGDAVTCQLTSDISCPVGNPALSNVVDMIIHPILPVSVAISASENPVCAGSLLTFTAQPENGGETPAYQWFSNGLLVPGATNATFTTLPADQDPYYCVLVSSETCTSGNPDTSNAVVVTVNELLPVSVSITASDDTVCAGTQVTFTATALNGGTNPVYEWLVNGSMAGTNSPAFSYLPAGPDIVTCRLIPGIACAANDTAMSNEVVIEVIAGLSAGTLGSDQMIFAGSAPAELTAQPPSNGTSPVYQMQVSDDGVQFTDIPGATSLNYQPDTLYHTTYYRQMQNAEGVCGGPLATNVVVVTVNQLLMAGVSISANPTEAQCEGTEVTFTAVPENGGTTPSYQWKVNGTNAGADSPVFTFTPADGDTVVCVMTSDQPYVQNNPATSEPLVMLVIPTPSGPEVEISIAPTGAVCAGTEVVLTASASNGGNSPFFQWKVNGTDAGTNSSQFTYVPQDGDQVVCMLTSSIPCATEIPDTSNAIVVTVNPVETAAVTLSASANPSCGGSPVTYTANPVNGGTTPSFQWKVNDIPAGTDSVAFVYTPANGDVIVAVMTSHANCVTGSPATSNSHTATVNAGNPVSVAISANPSESVCSGTNVTYTATPVNGGSAPVYQWKVNGALVGTNSPTYTYPPVNGDLVTCELTSDMPCATGNPAPSNSIAATVDPVQAVGVTIVASANPVVPSTSVTFTATPVNGGSSPTYQWKVNGTNVGTNSPAYTYTPVNNDNIVCVLTSSLTACVTGNPATSSTIVMSVAYGIPCPGTPTVTYGNKTYNTVQVGTQCWLKENLNIGTMIAGTTEQTNNSVIEKYCYNNDTASCNVYGGLYEWAEVVQYLNNATNTTTWNPVPTGLVQGICPSGWHLPTNAEWGALMTYLGGQSVAGGKLKEAGFTHFASPNTGATNLSGFTGLPGGQRWSTGEFKYQTNSGQFWTCTTGASPATDVYYGGVSYSTALATNGQFYKVTGISVRCIKNP